MLRALFGGQTEPDPVVRCDGCHGHTMIRGTFFAQFTKKGERKRACLRVFAPWRDRSVFGRLIRWYRKQRLNQLGDECLAARIAILANTYLYLEGDFDACRQTA